MSKETHMNIVKCIMFATGKATSIKQAVHMSCYKLMNLVSMTVEGQSTMG